MRILGEIGLAQSRAPGETKAFFAEAWARAQELENRPLMARCALGLSRAERGAGERGPAAGTSRCGSADADGNGHDAVASRGPGRPGEPRIQRIAVRDGLNVPTKGGAMGFAPEYHGYRFMQDSATNMQDAAPSGGRGREGLRIRRDGDLDGRHRARVRPGARRTREPIGTPGATRSACSCSRGKRSRALCTAAPVFRASPKRPPTSTAPSARRQAIAGPDGADPAGAGVRPDPTQRGDVQGSRAARRRWSRLPAHPGGIAALAGAPFRRACRASG